MSKMNQVGRVWISSPFMERLLQLPEGDEIYGVSWDFNTNCLVLFVRSERFKPCKPGDLVPQMLAVATEIPGQTRPAVKVEIKEMPR